MDLNAATTIGGRNIRPAWMIQTPLLFVLSNDGVARYDLVLNMVL